MTGSTYGRTLGQRKPPKPRAAVVIPPRRPEIEVVRGADDLWFLHVNGAALGNGFYSRVSAVRCASWLKSAALDGLAHWL